MEAGLNAEIEGPSADSRYIVGPVLKALKVLELIAAKGHGVSLTAVATALGLPKTSTFRYLRTLSAAGFVDYDVESDKYSVGKRFRALAHVDRGIHRLRECSSPVLRRLNREFNETINLAVINEGHVVYLDIIESTHALRFQARIGSRDPLHSTALGKAMLAFLSAAEQETCLSSALAERTLRTITEVKVLEKQLREIAAAGVAVEIGENEEGTMCLGVPVRDETGYPIAAISLSAPERRVTPRVRETAIVRLREAALEIAASR
jgi:DNA-binding IclR family transcriptional regulator